MKRIAVLLLALAVSPAMVAAETPPDQCFAQAKQLPADQQERFIKACLGTAASQQPSTVSPEQRAKVCATIAANEGFKGEQLDAFLNGCKNG